MIRKIKNFIAFYCTFLPYLSKFAQNLLEFW